MNFLLKVDPNSVLGFSSDTVTFGLETVLLGMGAIFSVLIIIWLCLTALKFFLHDLPEKRKTQSVVTATTETVAQPVARTQDNEIVAVIAAAIAAAESESSGLKFRVVSFRRK